ncbi:MAG: twin-arginine translocase subunit TatC [Proteobacteria bacterium]|nr:twin-arginine translocase subunit TatC [Pseudomonadota bacterium]
MELFSESRLALLRDIRKSLIRTMIICCLIFLGMLFFVEDIMKILKDIINMKLILYSLPEAFMSYLKVAFLLALLIIVPYIIFEITRVVSKHTNVKGGNIYSIVLIGTILFYGGCFFCYRYVLPSGIKFLLQYQTEYLKPMISLSAYISFVFTFLLGFGIMFELPLIMGMLGKIGIINTNFLNKQRRFFVLINSIVSAIVTPTPDVFNLLLMMVPMQVLYEIGVVVVYFTNKGKLQKEKNNV